jgi:hypothetical protein
MKEKYVDRILEEIEVLMVFYIIYLTALVLIVAYLIL